MKARTVYQFTLQGEFVAEHKNTDMAANAVNGCYACIRSVYVGDKKSAYGYIWLLENNAEAVNKRVQQISSKKPIIEEEEWRDIQGYEGLYQVSNFGRVRSLERVVFRDGFPPITKHERIRDLGMTEGYLCTNLYKDGHVKRIGVHRLVAEAFIPNPENKPCVDHIDGSRDNNHVENLRWCTHKENSNYPIALERLSKGIKATSKARLQTKIRNKSRNRPLPVRAFDLNGNLVGEWSSLISAARQFGKPIVPRISECCRGLRETAVGLKWEYAEEV